MTNRDQVIPSVTTVTSNQTTVLFFGPGVRTWRLLGPLGCILTSISSLRQARGEGRVLAAFHLVVSG
jgi:hypothetical protein